MDEKILTKHPQGKKGVNISKVKYDLVRKAVLRCVTKGVTHNQPIACVERRLTGKFQGSIGWYAESLKLDLEANNFIERTDDRPRRTG